MSWGDVAASITAIAAVVALVGSYVQFVLKPSILPSAEFDVDFVPLYRDGEHLYGEIAVTIKNVGSNTLVVKNVRYRARYLSRAPVLAYPLRPSEPQFEKPPEPQGEERYEEPQQVSNRESDPSATVSSISGGPPAPLATISSPSSQPSSVSATASGEPASRLWFLLVRERTFIQPGVTQRYRKPVILPLATFLVDVVAAFDYEFKLRRFRTYLVRLSDPAVGQVNWTGGISNHTVRHTVYVAPMPPT